MLFDDIINITASSVPDIPRLYTGIAEWTACLVCSVGLARKRFSSGITWLLRILSLAVFCLYQLGVGQLPIGFWIPAMIGAAFLMVGMLFLLHKDAPANIVIVWARAFVLAEFAASLEWQLYYFLWRLGNPVIQSIAFNVLFFLFVCAACFAIMFLIEWKYARNSLKPSLGIRNVILALGTAVATFAISNISFVSTNNPLSGDSALSIFYIRTLVDVCGLILLYVQLEQRQWVQAQVDLDAMHGIVNRQYEQYRLSKENIDTLNRRYHDLKHQIFVLRTELDPVKRNEVFEQMEQGIKMYEAENKTGNGVLDVILTDKSLQCAANDINFTCVADGKQIEFMDVLDICSIFGNALDNAVECELRIPDKSKRIIKVAVYAQNNFVMIRINNYTEENIVFSRGLPVTTKEASDGHGYGVKSIRQCAEKYGGSVQITLKDNWFNLCVLLPRDREKQNNNGN